jgi:hypothetical protein
MSSRSTAFHRLHETGQAIDLGLEIIEERVNPLDVTGFAEFLNALSNAAGRFRADVRGGAFEGMRQMRDGLRIPCPHPRAQFTEMVRRIVHEHLEDLDE